MTTLQRYAMDILRLQGVWHLSNTHNFTLVEGSSAERVFPHRGKLIRTQVILAVSDVERRSRLETPFRKALGTHEIRPDMGLIRDA